ncbi:MAG TPA: hypothetical protein VKR06_20425, partial [Ktedonosporobacter sp.]|nr:hypothetical protein [Ktedonosporobacter sp.]
IMSGERLYRDRLISLFKPALPHHKKPSGNTRLAFVAKCCSLTQNVSMFFCFSHFCVDKKKTEGNWADPKGEGEKETGDLSG